MDESRRSLLKKIGYAASATGLGCGFPLLRALASPSEAPHAQGAASAKQLGMVIDIQKCLNQDVVRACINACNKAHNVPTLVHPDHPERKIRWIWTEDYEHAFPDQAHAHFSEAQKSKPVLLMCNHCTSPACVKVCPTKATWKRELDGIVMMDMHRCIGCRYCVVACPYGSRSFNWGDPRPDIEGEASPEYPTRTKGVVEKCNFCAERILVGLEPACVEASRTVPGGQGALTFGDLSDPDSDVSRLLREKNTICRRIGLGTGPNVFYIV